MLSSLAHWPWLGSSPLDKHCLTLPDCVLVLFFPGVLPLPAEPATPTVAFLIPVPTRFSGQRSLGLPSCLAASQHWLLDIWSFAHTVQAVLTVLLFVMVFMKPFHSKYENFWAYMHRTHLQNL